MLEDNLDGFAAPKPQSYLGWMINSAGATTWLILFLVMLLAIGLILVLWWRGRGQALGPAMLLVTCIPLVAGMLAVAEVSLRGLLHASVDERMGDTLLSQTNAMVTAMGSLCCFFPVVLLAGGALLWSGHRAGR